MSFARNQRYLVILFASLVLWGTYHMTHDIRNRAAVIEREFPQTQAVRETRPHEIQWKVFEGQHNTKAKLKGFPAVLEDGEDIVISWRGIANPTTRDFISSTCGPTFGYNDFLERKNASGYPSGSIRFSALINMRCNYTFTYFNYEERTQMFTSLQSVAIPALDPISAPKHGHIAFTENDDEMAVSYTSGWNHIAPQVQYGLSEDKLIMTAAGVSTTYRNTDMCHAPATTFAQIHYRDPGFMHTVILKKLRPTTRYYYRYGCEAGGWSKVYSFRSRPSNATEETKFIAYGDMGAFNTPGAVSTVRAINEEIDNGYDNFLLHIGDISYAISGGYVWERYMNLIEPIATRIPYMVSVGNHEYDHTSGGEKDPSGAPANGFHPSWGNYGDDSGGECAVPVVHRFHVPQNGHSVFWYSFNYGRVHVIQISTEHDWREGSKQYAWIESDLASVDRTQTPWIVFTAHRMMYTTQVGIEEDRQVARHVRHELEDLLVKYHVNLMLVGHQHSYERSCPVYKGKCQYDKNAPVHIVVGTAGYEVATTGFSTELGEWSMANIDANGYLRITATEENMRIQFILNENGAIFDDITLNKWN